MSDDQEREAEALLPCVCYRHLEPFREHHETCPAYYRSVVAALCAKLERFKREWEARCLKAEAKVEEQESLLEGPDKNVWLSRLYHALVDRNTQLAAARQENQARFVAGLEAAKEIAESLECTFLQEGCTGAELIREAIDARIAAEKKEGLRLNNS